MNNISHSFIFTIPIDGEVDEKDSSFHHDSGFIKNEPDNSKQNNVNIINNSLSNFVTLNDNDKKLKNINTIKEETNENKWVLFSSLNTQKTTSSMANSSKMYMCEFLKHNWKLKAKRLLLKLKKKYSKKITNEDINITNEKASMSQCSDSKSEE